MTSPRPAAALVLSAGSEESPELLLIERSKNLRAMGGYTAFPGGVADRSDAAIPVVGLDAGEAATAIACGVREVFEEVGLLLGRREGPWAEDTGAQLSQLREALQKDLVDFGDILEREGVSLHAEDFEPIGRWTTPPIAPKRFDTLFFHCRWYGTRALDVQSAEVAGAGWVTAAEALAGWRDGSRLMVPPVRSTTQAFLGGLAGVAKRALEHPSASGNPVAMIDAHEGMRMVPQEVSTLPPFTHTNGFLLGDREILIVDPAGKTDEARAGLDAQIQMLVDEGRTPIAITLTHQHPDHIGGVAHVKERWGLPLWAHPETASRIDVSTDRELGDSEVIELAGDFASRWRVLHLPGHAYGHLCFLDEATHTCITGDNVLGIGTTLIKPPEGDMATYLQSLERLREQGVRTILPAHGPPLADGDGKIAALIRHRLMREQKVVTALAAAPSEGATLDELLPHVYDDVDEKVWKLARLSLQAHMQKLVGDGQAQAVTNERFAPT